MKWMRYWMRHAPWAAALAALILIAETDASATNQEPSSWWVDIDVDTGKSSDTEFVRRLLESPSTASDSLVIELDWEEVGAVRYAYSLEGAASAIREAGQPCGIG